MRPLAVVAVALVAAAALLEPPREPSPFAGVRSARVAGRVLAPDGPPAAGVLLTVRASAIGLAGERVGAVVTGEVVTADDEPLDATVTFTRLDADGERTLEALETTFGFFEQRCPPGRYRVEAVLKGELLGEPARRERVVVVGTGEVELDAFVFEELVGGVDGVVLCGTGVMSSYTARLRPLGGERRPRAMFQSDRSIVLRLDGDYLTTGRLGHDRFEFPLLPRGAYELTIEPPWPGLFEPVTQTVVPPAHALDIRLGHCARPSSIRLVPVDRATGAPLSDVFLVLVATDSLWHVTVAETLPAQPATEVDGPPQTSFVWALWTPGRAPAHGRSDELPADGEPLRVPLDAGWGGVVRLRPASQRSATWHSVLRTPLDPSVAGLELFADDVRVAVTDECGTAFVSLPQRPSAITVPGWRTLSPADVVELVERGSVLDVEPLSEER